MPSPFPNSFASAAAGNQSQENTSTSSRSARGDGNSSGDWSRNRTNGTTTFQLRRPSLANSSSHQGQSSSNQASSTSNIYIPPHQLHQTVSRNGVVAETRYSKEQMLGIFKAQKDSGELGREVSSSIVSGWDPSRPGEHSANPWTKRDESNRDASHGPEICWDHSGSVLPLGLSDMTDEEKEHFSTSVNSLIKPPPQSAGKDSQAPQTSMSNRKSSISGGQASQHNYGLTSPTSSRPGPRRRDTSDAAASSSSITSPTRSRFFRDDTNPNSPPPSLSRRRTDLKDLASIDDKDKEVQSDFSPFGGLVRRNTGGPSSSQSNGPGSPWSTTNPSSAFSPMGSFGSFLGGSGPIGSAGDKAKGYGSLRGESRFSKMMNKDSNEDMRTPREQSSFGNLTKVSEAQEDLALHDWRSQNRTSRGMSSVTDPFGGDEDGPSGSAALSGGQDTGFSQYGQRNPEQTFRNNFLLSDLGMSSAEGAGLSNQQRHSSVAAQEPYSPTETNPYTSPAAEKEDLEDIDTDGSEIHNAHHPGLNGIGGEQGIGGSYSGFPRNISGMNELDRSQTSSTGASRGFPNLGSLGGLGGLGSMSGWPPSSNPIGTPDRERSGHGGPFGTSVFGNMGDLQSPSLTAGAYGAGNTLGRGSKLGSLFPPAMQAQMQGGDGGPSDIDKSNDSFGKPLAGSIRQTDSPLRSNRGMLDELNFQNIDATRPPLPSDQGFTRPEQSGTSISKPNQTPISASSSQDFQQAGPANPQSNQVNSSQPPTNQQRMMVMPDRIRWIYRDPQGTVQGPWSGLEMHDWYKAGFFTPDLMVKKVEDPEYEPLGQLIRRIGNSREPFLVPQIGIPHGPASAQPSGWSAPGAPVLPSQTSSATGGSVQPPFAGSFPSFGTTLTAEQQNALERRKQEEQYLMARQKEYLAQQQIMTKHHAGIHGMGSSQLNHHSSANSLQSQPSFGSITSPSGFQPTPPQPPIPTPQGVPPFLDTQLRQVGSMGQLGGNEQMSAGAFREDDMMGLMSRLNMSRDIPPPLHQHQPQQQPSFSQLDASLHSQQVAAVMAQRAQLQREQSQQQALGNVDEPDFEERFQQFKNLRNSGLNQERDSLEPFTVAQGQQQQSGQLQQPIETQQARQHDPSLTSHERQPPLVSNDYHQQQQQQQEILSLTQQVQKAASAKHTPTQSVQPQSPWAKVESSALPQPFPPPPQSASPLPAPSAQRARQNLPETFHTENASRSQTPSVDTPSASIAPWARDASEGPGPKGPSLREIQEAESRKAAKAEEAAAALRRVALEQERLNQPPPPTAGLPSSATWGSASSPLTPTGNGNGSVWSKTGPQTSKPADSNKKSLSQIQKEEEARKQRAAAATASSQANIPSSLAGGKRYADLASKTAVPLSGPSSATAASASSGGAWTTVGTGGAKPKIPLGPSPAAVVPPGFRTPSGNIAAAPPAAGAKSRQATGSYPTAKGTASSSSQSPASAAPANKNTAKDELTRWARRELTGKMSPGFNVETLITQLMIFPLDFDLIKESVHASSQTISSGHFAEEFIRRRRQADKGQVIPADSSPASASNGSAGGVGSSSGQAAGQDNSKGGDSNSGGWSAVARKANTTKQDDNSNQPFKVVAGKKKNRK